MTKKYLNLSFIYAIAAMVFGVFYREFTKFSGFEGKTNLSVMHTHYFALGMVMFLIFALLEKNFEFSAQKRCSAAMLFYNIGLNVAAVAFFVRGFLQVKGTELSKALDAAISEVAGLGHTALGLGIILILLCVKKSAGTKEKA